MFNESLVSVWGHECGGRKSFVLSPVYIWQNSLWIMCCSARRLNLSKQTTLVTKHPRYYVRVIICCIYILHLYVITKWKRSSSHWLKSLKSRRCFCDDPKPYKSPLMCHSVCQFVNLCNENLFTITSTTAPLHRFPYVCVTITNSQFPCVSCGPRESTNCLF